MLFFGLLQQVSKMNLVWELGNGQLVCSKGPFHKLFHLTPLVHKVNLEVHHSAGSQVIHNVQQMDCKELIISFQLQQMQSAALAQSLTFSPQN